MKIKVVMVLVVAGLVSFNAFNGQSYANTQPDTKLVSVSTVSNDNNQFYGNSISGDGRYVVFASGSPYIVTPDTNGGEDVFLRDTHLNTTRRITNSVNGSSTNNISYEPRISHSGRFVVYSSRATNMTTEADNNYGLDVFIYDTQLQTTALVSKNPSGTTANRGSYKPDVSADGRYVVFMSDGFNLDPSIPTNQALAPYGAQVFVRDMITGQVKIVSNRASVRVDNAANDPRISCDGGLVSFSHSATNLVPNDTNGVEDVFTVNLVNGANNITNVTALGNGRSYQPSISCDGNYISMTSAANNLTTNDINAADDVVFYNRLSQTHGIVSVASDGTQSNGTASRNSSLSSDGKYIVFESDGTNLVQNFNKAQSWNIYLRNTKTGITNILNTKIDGSIANKDSDSVDISKDGSFVTYRSNSDDLIPGISNPGSAKRIYISRTGY